MDAPQNNSGHPSAMTFAYALSGSIKMKKRFETSTIDGTFVEATKVWHEDSCWRYVFTCEGRYVGDMLWEEQSSNSACLIDVRLKPSFRSKGIGTAMMTSLLFELRVCGFKELTGDVVAQAGIEKDRLCLWYESLGGTVGRQYDPENPLCAGTLVIPL